MKKGKQNLSLINSFDLDNPLAAEFRRLLNNIKNSSKTGENKTVLVTSAMVGEGKSTACCFLAMTAARRHLRTLVVDCDLRRPSIHRLLDLPRETGIVEALSEGVAIRHTIKKTSLDKLDVITAGKPASAPSELFEDQVIGEYLEELKFYYDLIFIDCAPVLPVSDPMMLSSVVDAILIVVKAGSTQRELVSRATEIMKNGSGRILGVVLNNMVGALPYYCDSSHYSYQYDQQKAPVKKSGGQSSESTESVPTDKKRDSVSGKNSISG